MNIRDTLLSTLRDYLVLNKLDFKGNKPDYLSERELKKSFGLNYWSSNYKIKGSVGQGNWATIPWIAIFDSDISEGARKGFYIVYLFSKDMQKVYLSLNQGWTYFDNTFRPKQDAKQYITAVSNYWRNKLKIQSLNHKISIKPINLEANYQNSNTKLPEGYELGNIFSIEYQINNMPQNEELIKDIESFKNILTELKSNLNDLGQKDFLDENISRIIYSESDSINFKKSTPLITKVTPPTNIYSKLHSSNNLSTIFKTDYKKKVANNELIGKMGEQAIYENELSKFIKYPQIQKNIELVSETKGDGLGYDIISFREKNNEPVYIEVKTTNSNINQPFYLTQNELKAAKKFGKAYSIYRVFKTHDNTVSYFEINGEDLLRKYKLTPNNYEVSLN